MNNQPTDRRVRRTRAKLHNTLVALLEEKAFNDIQVQEIAERANLARATFYLHFNSKEALFFSYVEEVFEQIRQAVMAHPSHTLEALLTHSYQQWHTHQKMFVGLMQVEDQSIFISGLQQHLALILRQSALHHRSHQREYIMRFITGGTYLLLCHWISDGMTTSPEDMGTLTSKLIYDVIH